jgi:hypothetical protein
MSRLHFAVYLALVTWGAACFVAAPVHTSAWIIMLVVVPLLLAATMVMAWWAGHHHAR